MYFIEFVNCRGKSVKILPGEIISYEDTSDLMVHSEKKCKLFLRTGQVHELMNTYEDVDKAIEKYYDELGTW